MRVSVAHMCMRSLCLMTERVPTCAHLVEALEPVGNVAELRVDFGPILLHLRVCNNGVLGTHTHPGCSKHSKSFATHPLPPVQRQTNGQHACQRLRVDNGDGGWYVESGTHPLLKFLDEVWVDNLLRSHDGQW